MKEEGLGGWGPLLWRYSSPVPFCLLDRMAAPWAQGPVGALLLSSSYVLSGVVHLPDVHPHALGVWSPKQWLHESWALSFMLQGHPVSGSDQRPLQYDSSSVLWWPKHGGVGSWAPGLKITTVMKEKEGPGYQGFLLGGWLPTAILLVRQNGCPLDAGTCRCFNALFIQSLIRSCPSSRYSRKERAKLMTRWKSDQQITNTVSYDISIFDMLQYHHKY